MKFRFVAAHREQWPVRVQCEVLGVSVSGFYDWLGRTPGPRSRRRAALTEDVREIHATSRQSYGSPRVWRELGERGEAVSEKTVASIMQDAGLQGKYARRRVPRTTQSDHGEPIAPNRLERDFTASGPDEKWTSDITYIATDEGWLYTAVVMDVFSRNVVGWSTAEHLGSALVEEALRNAITQRRPQTGLLHHSDRGVQYASRSFRGLLAEHGIVCSMSRKGDCYDNAVTESFFGTLKTELDERMSSRSAARRQLFEYIEVFYNRQRRHSALGYVSPVAFEQARRAA